ncbi:CU044_5270 family protein [Actinomadura sp. NPDC047616]|uniref:CU044_5270 family protein n=1 Tax=Actinomadura sp. NPDC047616 TaxID=3155914 RepID=UPI0033DDF86F
MLELTRTAGRAPAHQHERRDERRAGRRNGWLRGRRPLGIGLGLVAAAAATAVAVATVGSGGAAPAQRSAPGPREMVLAAAVQAERQADGRYLVTHVRNCHAEPVKARTGDYIVQPCYENWRWRARDRANESAVWTRDLPARPQTPQDEALWKRAGSPRTFPYSQDPKALPNLYRTTPTPWKEDRSDRNENSDRYFLPLTGRSLTAEELRNLPTDPKELEKLLTPRPPKGVVMDRRASMTPTGPGQKIVQATLAVSDLPLPPKVWAAFIRMLTDTPGVRAVGRVTDPIGRPGVALEAPRTAPASGGGTSMERAIFDPDTGVLLATVSTTVKRGTKEPAVYRPGTVENYEVIVKSEWTDSRPSRPASD